MADTSFSFQLKVRDPNDVLPAASADQLRFFLGAGGVLLAKDFNDNTVIIGGVSSFAHGAVITVADSPYAAGIQETVKADPTAGVVDVDLPTAIGNTGLKVQVTVVFTNGVVAPNAVNVRGTLGQLINGEASIPLTVGGQSLVVESDGANWVPIA